ncbi:MAG: DUF2461 domain-containing protein [Oscillospiraceae bacterium]|nr:DUF2461 domain-containing protein [Oscillospiraceae bacterium]
MEFDRMLRYCALLEQNNNRGWFHENHKLYEDAKRDFTDLTNILKYRVAELVSPELSERLLYANAKDMLYRIPRDMRVWRNAPPYNPTWRAYIAGDRHAMWPVGYFYMVAPGKTHFGTGAWCPDSQWLRRVRSAISGNFERFAMALADAGYPLSGDSLKRVPAGFDPGDPAGEYLKYKEWFVSEQFQDGELTDFDAFADRCCEAVRRMEPLRRFFDDVFAQKAMSPWDTEGDGE